MNTQHNSMNMGVQYDVKNVIQEYKMTEEEIKKDEEGKVDARTAVGKKLKDLEDKQAEILKTLAEHSKKIAECSIQR